MRPTCSTENCNNPCKYNGYKKDGSRKFYKLCSSCCKRKYNDKWIPKKNPSGFNTGVQEPWTTKYGGYVKKCECEYCGFVPLHRCQLDVDHINGDKKDNRESNLQTLCANCHRLKTLVNEDWK